MKRNIIAWTMAGILAISGIVPSGSIQAKDMQGKDSKLVEMGGQEVQPLQDAQEEGDGRFETAQDMVIGQEYQVEFQEGGDAYFKFVPQQTGIYVFSSTGECDTYGSLYSASFDILYENDDSDTLNFRIDAYLEAGTVYYLKASTYENAAAFSVNVAAREGIWMTYQRDVTVTYGEKAILEVKGVSSRGELHYQWYKGSVSDENKIEGAVGDRYEVAEDNTQDCYYCVATDGVDEETAGFLLDIDTELSVGSDVGTLDEEDYGVRYVDIAYGEEIALSVNASSLTGNLSYLWFKGYDMDEGDNIIEGATENTYTVNEGGVYSCRVCDGVLCKELSFRVRVDSGLTVGSDIGEPSEYDPDVRQVTLAYGEEVVLSVDASGGAGPLTYEWYSGYDGENEIIEGATGSSYTTGESRFYTCYVSDGIMVKKISFDVQVETGFYASSDTGEAYRDGSPNYRLAKAKSGETVTFTVDARSEAPLVYDWYVYDPEEYDWITIGNMESTYAVQAEENREYMCEVSDGSYSGRIYFDVLVDVDYQWEPDTETLTVSGTGSVPCKIGEYMGWPNNMPHDYLNIIIQDGITELEDKAFFLGEETEYPGEITIPESVTKIGRHAVGYYSYYDDGDDGDGFVYVVSSGWTIHCYQDSAAHRYAEENGVKYELQGAALVDINDCAIQLGGDRHVYSGMAIKPQVTVKDGDKTLTEGTDYEVSYQDNVDAGNAKAIVTGKGNYTGTVTKPFAIQAKAVTGAQVAVATSENIYDGTAKKPQVTVKDGDKTLTEGTDYGVSYEDNVNAGNAKAVVTGKGNYAGTIEKGFVIQAKAMTGMQVTVTAAENTYNGTAIKPQVTVKDGDKTLAEGTDYEVSYKNNVNAGNAEVAITGKGNYTGTVRKPFAIRTKGIAGARVSLGTTRYIYNGKDCKPKVTVTLGGKRLVAGMDYDVSYKNNRKIGNASVTITGKHNYSGVLVKTFAITVKKGSVYTVGKYKYKVTSASAVAFSGLKNTKVTKVTVPKSITIGGKAFWVTSVAKNALKKTAVKTVSIGDNVKEIGNSALEGCSKLTKVTIGKNVTKIGSGTFKNCKKLTTVTITSTKLKSVGKNAFKGIKSNAKIKVPAKKRNAYRKILQKKGQGKKVQISSIR
ncbi:leucine-rich repeat domain-containing protein [Lachnospiraceae bacterium 29-84]